MADKLGDRFIVRIRRASIADEVAIIELVPRLVEFGPPTWRDTDVMTQTDIAVISESLRSSTDDPVIYVAEGHSEELAGFIHLRSVTDYYRRKAHGHVADIVVARAYEGHGLAKQLLSKAEEWAIDQGFDWLSISIFNGNTRAKHLYETLGYRSDIARLVKPLC